MANPCTFTVCTLCKSVHDATLGTTAWFMTDGMLTPVRGTICGACALVRSEAGEHPETVVDRRGKEVDDGQA